MASAPLLSYVAGSAPSWRSGSSSIAMPRPVRTPRALARCPSSARRLRASRRLPAHPRRTAAAGQFGRPSGKLLRRRAHGGPLERRTKQLVGNAAWPRALNAPDFRRPESRPAHVQDILAELAKPGRDPRSEFQGGQVHRRRPRVGGPAGRHDPGGRGHERHAFGAFVDIGVHQDGLIHISQLANTFVQDPSDVVAVGRRRAREGPGSRSRPPPHRLVAKTAYCQFPLCGPSRNSMLTGLYPNSTGICGTRRSSARRSPRTQPAAGLPAGRLFCRPDRQAVSLQRAQLDRHQRPRRSRLVGTGVEPGRRAIGWRRSRTSSRSPRASSAGTLSWYASPKSDQYHTDGLLAADAEWVLERCAKQKERPFFLAVGFYRPHTPYVAPRPYFGYYPESQMPSCRESRRIRPICRRPRWAATRRSRTS
jgi:hypothetical protein